MSDITTIARPYAKAIFEIALASKQLAEWSSILTILTQAVSLSETVQFITNPSTTGQDHLDLFVSLLANLKVSVDSKLQEQFITVLVENNRLLLIPGICIQYELLRAEQEKTLTVSVSTYSELSKKQEQRLIDTLTQRLQRQVSLEISIDKSLLGGALIKAGDLVIDGSVQGQLLKLASSLAA
jgi:F-type H+-transporting ATPase subunit delta